MANVAAGQRRTSNLGGPAVEVVEQAAGFKGRWLVRIEGSGLMMTIEESYLLDDYDLDVIDEVALDDLLSECRSALDIGRNGSEPDVRLLLARIDAFRAIRGW